MATIRKEFRSSRTAEDVWAVLRRFDAVHELAPGFVAATRLEPDGTRIVTFANGLEVREWLVSLDDAERRLVYAILESPRYSHYSASAQVLKDGSGSRFVWTVDFLPDTQADTQEKAMAAGIAAIQRSLG